MLQRMVRLLGQAVDPVVVVAAPGQVLPVLAPSGRGEAIAIVRDAEKGRGPLQGLAAGLEFLEGKVQAAYVSSCDVPLLKPAFIRRLIDLLGDHVVCVPRVEDHHHPLAAVYRLEVFDAVKQLLAADRLRPYFLLEAVSTRVVEAAELADVDPSLQTLRNVNTPEDYDAALRELSSS